MKTRIVHYLIASAIVAAIVMLSEGVSVYNRRPTRSQYRPSTAELQQEKLDRELAVWPESSRLMAKMMTERYGWPDALDDRALVWRDRAPWKRVAVHRWPKESPLAQTVGYLVPERAEAALTAFENGVSFDRARDELTSQADREELNILGLNMADAIASGKMSVDDARSLFVLTAERSAAGKGSRWMKRLQFKPYQPSADMPLEWPRPPLY